jgi:hypothetical protein
MTTIRTFGLTLIAGIMTMSVSTVTSHTQPAQFTASPINGKAPLTVTFCSVAGIGIDFGDGTSSGMDMAQSGDCPAGGSFTSMVRHTYTAAGSYQLRGFPCPSSTHGNECGQVARQASAVKITVTPPS